MSCVASNRYRGEITIGDTLAIFLIVYVSEQYT
jgi:hypothetical protein